MFTLKHSPSKAISIGEKVLASQGHGSVTKIARIHKISRGTCYNYARKAAFVQQYWSSLATDSMPLVLRDKMKWVLGEYLLHHDSVSKLLQSFQVRGEGISRGEISEIIHRCGSLLPAYDTLPAEADSISCIAIDETFAGGSPYLAVIDTRTGYILSLTKANNRRSATWTQQLRAVLGDNKRQDFSICADFARPIRQCLSGLTITFHGDLFHYHRVMGKALGQLWRKFTQTYKQWEETDKKLKRVQKALAEQIAPNHRHREAVQTAMQAQHRAYEKTTQAMQQYDNAQFLCQQSKHAFDYFDEQGCWISHQQARQMLQTVAELGRLIPDQQWQKALDFFERQLPTAIQYIADIQDEICHLLVSPITADHPNSAFLWQVAASICRHQQKARGSKQYVHQLYHQQQALQWQTMLAQHIGEETTQTMLQSLQTLLAKANRSSSMIETVNSRLKPFLRAARGQITQERLNLIRYFLNHYPYARSRVAARKGFSPYQLFYQQKNDKRNWFTFLCEEYLIKSA